MGFAKAASGTQSAQCTGFCGSSVTRDRPLHRLVTSRHFQATLELLIAQVMHAGAPLSRRKRTRISTCLRVAPSRLLAGRS